MKHSLFREGGPYNIRRIGPDVWTEHMVDTAQEHLILTFRRNHAKVRLFKTIYLGRPR